MGSIPCCRLVAHLPTWWWLAIASCMAACNAVEANEAVEPTGRLERAAVIAREAREASQPDRAAALRYEAATLTEESFRETTDVRHAAAAISLYEAVESGPLYCTARLRAAVLRAETGGEVSELRALARRVGEQPDCEDAARRVLDTLGSGEPVPAVRESAPIIAAPRLGIGADNPLRVTRIERYGSPDSARIVVFLSGVASHDVGVLPPEPTRGPRLYVDVANAGYEGPLRFDVGGIVERVRLGETDAGVRVVLDLRERVYKRVFTLPEPFRLVVDVSSEAPQKLASRDRTLSRVVLDPGHGGFDPGAIGVTGLQEKDVALDVAHRAAPLLARELGIDTLLTRDGDEFVALDERVAKANAFGADLFISLHCNASESHESHGVMTFVLDSSGDALAERVAARENAASAAASQHFGRMLSELLDERNARRSLLFAELLQRSSMASLLPGYGPITNGGVRRAGFFVLAGAQMPAVLFEASFISNPLEEQKLDTADYRQKLADAVVNAVRAFRTHL